MTDLVRYSHSLDDNSTLHAACLDFLPSVSNPGSVPNKSKSKSFAAAVDPPTTVSVFRMLLFVTVALRGLASAV